MAKDPAVLFYYQDFLVGTEFMSDIEVGQYIRLLCHQADKGRLTKKHMLSVCKANGSQELPDFVKEKFTKDEHGLFYNERMEDEKLKRAKFVESRRKSALGKNSIRTAYAKRMEDVDVNENINENKDIIQNIWIRTWSRSPSIPEREETEKLIKQFGEKKIADSMRKASLSGFRNFGTFIDALDKNGDIKSKNEISKPEFVESEDIKNARKSLQKERYGTT